MNRGRRRLCKDAEGAKCRRKVWRLIPDRWRNNLSRQLTRQRASQTRLVRDECFFSPSFRLHGFFIFD